MFSWYKGLNRFLEEIDKRPGQYVFVRNNYTNDQMHKTENLEQVMVDQYIPHFDESGTELIETISYSESILKLALMID